MKKIFLYLLAVILTIAGADFFLGGLYVRVPSRSLLVPSVEEAIIGMNVEVINLSLRPHSFTLMSCSDTQSWTTDSAPTTRIHDRSACPSNDPIDRTLKPGESYKRPLKVKILPRQNQSAFSFKIGLILDQKKKTAWSKAIKVIG